MAHQSLVNIFFKVNIFNNFYIFNYLIPDQCGNTPGFAFTMHSIFLKTSKLKYFGWLFWLLGPLLPLGSFLDSMLNALGLVSRCALPDCNPPDWAFVCLCFPCAGMNVLFFKSF